MISQGSEKTVQRNKNGSILRLLFLGGLLGVLFISPFLRGLYFERELYSVMMAVALAFSCCMADQILHKDPDFFKHPLNWAMLALLMAYSLSIINAVHIHQALEELLTVAVFFMVYLMAERAVKNEKEFKRLLLGAYLMGVGLAIVGLGAAAGLINITAGYEDGHIRSAIQYHNTLAIYLAGLSFAGLILGMGKREFRMAFAAGNLLVVMVMVGAISRGTWLLYPVGYLLFMWLIDKQQRSGALLNWAVFFPYGIVAGLGFLNSISQRHETYALGFVLAALLIVVFMQWLADLNNQGPEASESRIKSRLTGCRQFLVIGIFLMVGLLLMLWTSPGSSVQLVPEQISAKVEKTSLQENSINDRLTFYRDSLKIAADYPLTGTGGGGWEALYHSYAKRLYWSREAHSYYLQTLVEAGSLGLLALLALAVIFVKMIIDFRRRPAAAGLADPALWAGITAVVMMGMHAIFDADFSLPSTGILFFALLGGIKGQIIKTGKPQSKLKKSGKKEVKAAAPGLAMVFPALGLLLAVLVFAGAASFYRAASLGAAGAKALEGRQAEEAEDLYLRAARLDPWKAGYQINLAQIQVIKADKSGNPEAGQAARDYAARAAELEPYNTRVHQALLNISNYLQDGDLKLAESEALVKANPLLDKSYEVLAGNNLEAAWYFLRSGNKKKADIYFNKVISVKEEMPAGAVRSGPVSSLIFSQAAIGLGNYEEARQLLEPLAKTKDEYRANALLWLAVSSTMEGKTNAAEEYLKQLELMDHKALVQYQSILKLLVLGNANLQNPLLPDKP